TNKSVVASGSAYAKNFFNKNQDSGGETMVHKYMKDIRLIKKNAFEDLKTGKFKNFDREMDSMMAGFGMGDDFGMMGMGEDDFGDYTDDSDLTSTHAVQHSLVVSETGSNKRTKALMDTIATSS